MNKNIQHAKKIKETINSLNIECDVRSEQMFLEPGVTFSGQILLSIGNSIVPFWYESVEIFDDKLLPRLKHVTTRYPNIILVGDIPREQQTTLRQLRIGYVANKDYWIPIEISSQLPFKQKSKKRKSSMTSSMGMSNLIFALLSCPDILSGTQREISSQTKQSLGVVNRYLAQLEEAEFISGRSFTNYSKLLDYWVADVQRYVKIGVQKYSPINASVLESLRYSKSIFTNGCWSGSKAVDVLHNSELASNFIIYSSHSTHVMAQLKLRPNPDGEVEIRRKFWAFNWQEEELGVAPLPLIYADLMMSQDPRDHKVLEQVKALISEKL